MRFHFIYDDGSILIFEASDAKHFTGHVALTDATLVSKYAGSYGIDNIPEGKVFPRINLALNGNLLCMWPEEEKPESLETKNTTASRKNQSIGFEDLHTI